MLIYISPSNMNKKVANSIQSNYMRSSFEKIIETFSFFQSNIYEENFNNILIKKIGSGFLNNILFSIKVLIKCKSIRKLSDVKNLIYSRSTLFTFFSYLIGYRKLFLEIHDLKKFSFSYLILLKLKKTKIIFICINERIKKDLIKIGVIKENIFVLSDGHGNKTNKISEALNKYKSISIKKQRIKIGYFGKLAPEKGSEILKSIILKYHQSIDFYIYSLNTDKFSGVPCKLKKIRHEEVYKEMKKMDILLYVSNLNKKNTHSKYTSPLKIYEYLSTLRPILFMPAGDLKKELKNTLSIKFNNYKDFYKALEKIISLKNPYDLLKNTHELSLNKTWDKRAEIIRNIAIQKFKEI